LKTTLRSVTLTGSAWTAANETKSSAKMNEGVKVMSTKRKSIRESHAFILPQEMFARLSPPDLQAIEWGQ
jgi:hypothetical protein